MRYSVWNLATGEFDYYDSPEAPSASNAPKPTHLKERTLGSTVEQAAYPLPSSAVRVGSGPFAMGRVGIEPGRAALGGDGDDLPLVKAGLLALAGALAVKVLLPPRRSRR